MSNYLFAPRTELIEATSVDALPSGVAPPSEVKKEAQWNAPPAPTVGSPTFGGGSTAGMGHMRVAGRAFPDTAPTLPGAGTIESGGSAGQSSGTVLQGTWGSKTYDAEPPKQ